MNLANRVNPVNPANPVNRANPFRRILAAATLAALAGPVVVDTHARVSAQVQAASASSPKFEVASVKTNKSGDGRIMIANQPGGRFTATNVPLRLLIRNAYQLQDFQIVGAPDWITSEHFDIAAKAEGDIPPSPPGGPPGPMQLMMQALLAERFKLVVHRDTRELQTYALVLARSDRKLGAQLRASAVDCAAMMRGRNGAPPPGPPPVNERPQCGMRIGPGQMSGGGLPMSQFATVLAPLVQRFVVDRTGLTGNYDIDLTFTPDQMPQGTPPPGAPPLPPIDPNGPSIFTAIQEQLGLKLDAQRGPVSVLVIDGVERPTEN
jgi:uncharacterized protein (TIGR03435 family)